MPPKKRLLLHSLYQPEFDQMLVSIFDEAVLKGKSLGRPFEEHEVITQLWKKQYHLMLN